MGIEPTSAAWEAAILPLNHARSILPYQTYRDFGKPVWDRICTHNAACGLHAAIAFDGAFRHEAFAKSLGDKSCYAVRLLYCNRGISGGPSWPIRTCANS